MANSFTDGLSAGSAVIAPFVAAQQQANAAQLAQSQEAARMLFQSQALQQQLAARAALAQQDIDARATLSQNEIAAREAAAANAFANNLIISDQNQLNALDKTNAQNDREDQKVQDQRDSKTALAKVLFQRINETASQLKESISLTEADQEKALAKALQLSGINIKRGSGEDFTLYLSKITQKNPEIMAAYQLELGDIQEQKALQPDVLGLQARARTLSDVFQNVMRSGNADPSVFDQINPPVDNVSANDLLAAAGNQPSITGQPAVAVNPQGPVTSVPANPGLFQTVPPAILKGVGSAIQGLGGLAEDARRGIFGSAPVSEQDVLDTRKFAEDQGINADTFNTMTPDQVSDLNQKRVKANSIYRPIKKTIVV